jgi:hypothetical protein
MWVSPYWHSAAFTKQLVSEKVAFTCTAILTTSDIIEIIIVINYVDPKAS